MVQVVYILEILKETGPIRAHFAQAVKAAQRAISKYPLEGEWHPVQGGGGVVSEFRQGDHILARVVRESVEYS